MPSRRCSGLISTGASSSIVSSSSFIGNLAACIVQNDADLDVGEDDSQKAEHFTEILARPSPLSSQLPYLASVPTHTSTPTVTEYDKHGRNRSHSQEDFYKIRDSLRLPRALLISSFKKPRPSSPHIAGLVDGLGSYVSQDLVARPNAYPCRL